MKKFLVSFLCLVFVLSLSCCTIINKDTASSSSEDTFVDIEIPSIPTVEDESYKDISCTKVTNFKEINFTTQSGDVMVSINIPYDWALQKTDNGYDIIKNSETIGNINNIMGSNYTDQTVNVYQKESTSKGFKITNYINRDGADNEHTFTRILWYNYDGSKKSRSIVLTFNYEEADSSTVHKMVTRTKTIFAPKKNLGVLKTDDRKPKILILGNSFVGTSNIGEILESMCDTKANVEAVSIGMATTSTFVQNGYPQKIRSGNYSVVFMCGLYNTDAFKDFEKIVEACEESGAKLAIFPAHNENRGEIDTAAEVYTSATLIDWKAEVDALITNGVAESLMYIEDGYNHSTPLAGYVGAHMIYRAVFGEIPTNTSVPEVTSGEIKRLGNYSTTGEVNFLDNKSAYIVGQ